MTTYPIAEHTHAINNVLGRMFTVHEPQEVRGNLVHRNQTWKSTSRPISGYGTNGQITVTLRFDDECKNGHQSFSITADVITDESRRQRDCAACGCLHEDIAAVFPELAPLIKWHLMSTDGPMHYIANTLYHAGDRDCNGLKKGEIRQIKNGKTGLPCWILEPTRADLPRSEGKPRDLDAARNTACWPEATDEELSTDRDTLKAALEARLPALIAEFRADMERIGFLWEPTT